MHPCTELRHAQGGSTLPCVYAQVLQHHDNRYQPVPMAPISRNLMLLQQAINLFCSPSLLFVYASHLNLYNPSLEI